MKKIITTLLLLAMFTLPVFVRAESEVSDVSFTNVTTVDEDPTPDSDNNGSSGHSSSGGVSRRHKELLETYNLLVQYYNLLQQYIALQ